jgi:bifunctional non-homologous end joining protein LigD
MGGACLHEIKHNGFRLMACSDGAGVRLLTRSGHDWSYRFPAIRAAIEALRVRSCLIDGEAIAFEENGLASFELLRGRRHDRDVTLCVFDLIELDGRDLRREPIERRKAMLAGLVCKPLPGLVLNATFAEPGDVVFKHACALGCEGIVSKRLGSRYRSGRSKDWLKFKNPNAPAVRRESEEDWGGCQIAKR